MGQLKVSQVQRLLLREQMGWPHLRLRKFWLKIRTHYSSSVLESLNNHSKEVIPIKPLAEFLQKIVGGKCLPFRFHYIEEKSL